MAKKMMKVHSKVCEYIGQTSEQRGKIYQFLAVLFISKPTIALVKSIKEPDFISSLHDMGLNLAGELLGKSDKELHEELGLEYDRLFICPGKPISLHESVWKNRVGLLWSQTTTEVKNFIESKALKYNPKWNQTPDHLGDELEFMRILVGEEKNALIKADLPLALKILEIERQFIDEHLTTWVPSLCKKIIRITKSNFYSMIAAVTKEFVFSEKTELPRIIKVVQRDLKKHMEYPLLYNISRQLLESG